MTAPGHGKAHTVIADSAFSSVQKLLPLKQRGTYFIGIVKTAHAKVPKIFMASLSFVSQGDHVAVSTTVQGHKVFGIGWLDGKRKDLVVTYGTTLPGTPAQRVRQQVVVPPTEGVSTRPHV